MQSLLNRVIACIGLSASIALAQERAPIFTDYPSRVVKIRRSIKIQLHSTPDTVCFRTMLHKAARQGELFAGHYAVGYWGCGTCLRLGIVDLTNGRTYVTPFEASSAQGIIKVQPNSRLLKIDDVEFDRSVYYLWNGRHLLPIYDRKVARRESERTFLRCAEITRFR